jgi:hypothetical protein
MPRAPDFFNPIYYSPMKRDWLLRPFPGLDDLQGNHSQLHQDLFVLCMLDGKRGGSYLEIGAGEPVFLSNTWLLESVFGWRGFAVELSAVHAQRHGRMRRNKCHHQDATRADYGALIAEAQLGEVIDYLSVDADPPPVTLAALKAIPHDRQRFRVITFEHDASSGGTAERDDSRRFLSALGYRLVVDDVAWGEHVVEDWWAHPALVDRAILEELACAERGIHEHDKYIYGGYRKI